MIIHVKQKHIDAGAGPDYVQNCAVAQACKEQMQTDNVQVGYVGIYTNGKKYIMPRFMYKWIRDWEYNKTQVKPISFELKEIEGGD